jgi:hypothetical protein
MRGDGLEIKRVLEERLIFNKAFLLQHGGPATPTTMTMRVSLILALQLLFQQNALQTLANTEIVNFAAGNPIPVPPLPQQNW